MNNLLNSMKQDTNYTHTENGALAHKTTNSALMDMFAMGAAMRKRSNEDVILMFKKAYEEDKTLALKCLFYLRDCRGGQGERRFFRICIKWLAKNYPREAKNLIKYVPDFGRWDDLYSLVNTPCEKAMFDYIKQEVAPLYELYSEESRS